MKTVISLIALFSGLAVADTCYMQLQQQFNGGIGGGASGIQGAIKRGDCPKDVDTPNTDNCEVLEEFTPGPDPSDVDAGLDHPVHVEIFGSTGEFEDGYMDYGDEHHDFNDDDDACIYSKSGSFSANLNMQVCSFEC